MRRIGLRREKKKMHREKKYLFQYLKKTRERASGMEKTHHICTGIYRQINEFSLAIGDEEGIDGRQASDE